MELITVKKNELIKKVTENRDAHRALFLEAQENYRKLVIEEFEKYLEDARSGRKIRRSISLPEPEDHTSDYNRILAMLEMSVDEEVELNEIDFSQYVMNQWRWAASFGANTLRYTSAYQEEHPGLGDYVNG